MYTFTWDGRAPLPWTATGSTFGSARLTVTTPSGWNPDDIDLDPGATQGQSLNVTGESGTYRLRVDPRGADTGSVTLKPG